MSSSNEISKDIFAEVINDDIGQSDIPQEGKLGRIHGDWAVGHSGVHLGHHVEVVEGQGLQLGAVGGDGLQVLGGDDGIGGALHVQS